MKYTLRIRYRDNQGICYRQIVWAFQPSKTDIVDVARRMRANGSEPLDYILTKAEIIEEGSL